MNSFSSTFCNIVAGLIGWTILYIFLKKAIFKTKDAEYSSRIVAAVHALVITPLSYMCYKEGPNPLQDGEGEPNTYLQTKSLEISISYFLYDLTWCLYYGSEPFIMLVHHICSIGSISVILVKDRSGAEAVMGLGTMEASNPYLQLRWFLRTAGYNQTRIHTFVELYFIALFLIMRIGFGSQLTYKIMKSSKVDCDVKICTLFLYLISLGFIFYIYQFIKRKYFKSFLERINRLLS